MKTSMKTCICIGLVILAIIGIAGCVGSNEQKSEVAQPAEEVTTPISEPTTASGTVIATWSGDDGKTTEPFTVPSSPWIVEWDAQNSTKYTHTVFSIFVYDQKNNLIDIAVDSSNATIGSTYEYEPAGVYHLEIFSGMPYNITVKTA